MSAQFIVCKIQLSSSIEPIIAPENIQLRACVKTQICYVHRSRRQKVQLHVVQCGCRWCREPRQNTLDELQEDEEDATSRPVMPSPPWS
jgi:hypothetical protein